MHQSYRHTHTIYTRRSTIYSGHAKQICMYGRMHTYIICMYERYKPTRVQLLDNKLSVSIF